MLTPVIPLILALILSQPANAQLGWSWATPLPHGNRLNDVHVFDANSAICVGTAGTVMRTTNGGTTWSTHFYVVGTADNLREVSFPDASHGTAVGENGLIIRTTDGGSTGGPRRPAERSATSIPWTSWT